MRNDLLACVEVVRDGADAEGQDVRARKNVYRYAEFGGGDAAALRRLSVETGKLLRRSRGPGCRFERHEIL